MTPASPYINRWHAFAPLAVAYFMTIVDLTIVNVSLPTISRDLHFSATNHRERGEPHGAIGFYS